MTDKQIAAQVESAPTTAQRLTQHQRIVQLLNRNEKHEIDQKIAGWLTVCYTTKLATRIGEMERAAGVTLQRRRDPATRFTKYKATPDVLAALNDFYFPKKKEICSKQK